MFKVIILYITLNGTVVVNPTITVDSLNEANKVCEVANRAENLPTGFQESVCVIPKHQS